jgi:hypothetical protein
MYPRTVTSFFNPATNTWVEWDFANGATSQIDDTTFAGTAGTFTITSDNTGTLKIGNVDHPSTGLQIFDIPRQFQNKETVLAGGPVQFNQAVSTKTGNNQLTFSAGSQIIAGTRNIFDSAIDLILNDTTLNMSNTTQSISSITISGNSIIDFGGSDASLTLANLIVTSGTLTIQNWTGDPGDFYVSNTVDPTTVSNVIFEGWDGAGGTPSMVSRQTSRRTCPLGCRTHRNFVSAGREPTPESASIWSVTVLNGGFDVGVPTPYLTVMDWGRDFADRTPPLAVGTHARSHGRTIHGAEN